MISARVETTRTATCRTAKSYTVYVIVVKYEAESLSWMVDRRFKEFAAVHENLLTKFSSLPNFPKKTWFNMDAELVESRRESLDFYLSKIVQLRPVLLCSVLQEFLSLAEHGVTIKDPTAPIATTVLTDPKFGVNDVAFDDRNGVLLSAGEDTNFISRIDSFISNVRLPWEEKGAMVPVGSVNMWKRDESSEWRVTACAYFECQATSVAYNPERRYSFIGLDNGFVHIHRVNDSFDELILVSKMPIHKQRVSKLIYIAQKDCLISCGRDSVLSMYDVAGCRLVTSHDLNQARLMCMLYDETSERVFVGSDNHSIAIVDIRGNMFNLLHVLSGHTGPVRALHFIQSKMNLVSGGGRSGLLWTINKRSQTTSRCRIVGALKGGPSSDIRCIMHNIAHHEVLTACNNGIIAVWNTVTGDLRHVMEAHAGPITLIQWLDRDKFVTASRDGNITFWKYPLEQSPKKSAQDSCEDRDKQSSSGLNTYAIREMSATAQSSVNDVAVEILEK